MQHGIRPCRSFGQPGWRGDLWPFKIGSFSLQSLIPRSRLPLPAATPVSKSPWESSIIDLTGTDDPVPSASPMPARESLSLDATAPVNRETGRTPDALPLVLNGFLTLLNTADKKKVGGLARAFHLAMQLAGCGVPNFPHDSLRRQWERLRASLPLRPTVTQAVAYFVKAHPQDDPSVPAAGQHPAVQAHKSNQSTGSRRSGGGLILIWQISSGLQCPMDCCLRPPFPTTVCESASWLSAFPFSR